MTAASGWGETDMQATLDQYESDLSGGADFFKFLDGDNLVRLCPPAAGETRPFVKRAQHWRVGDAEKVMNCPRAVQEDASCFLCDKIAELKKSDDEADNDKGHDLYAKQSWLYRIIDMTTAATQRKGVQVMSAGIKTHKQIAKLLKDKDFGNITHPETGTNIIIEKTGSGMIGTDYIVRPRRNASDVTDLLEGLAPPDISAVAAPATNKAMKAAWNNEASDTPKEKPKAESSRRRNVDDEEPTPARAAADEAEEPEERPARRRASINDDAKRVRPEAADDEPVATGRRLSSVSRDAD